MNSPIFSNPFSSTSEEETIFIDMKSLSAYGAFIDPKIVIVFYN
jgi:hypothetical protein